jgi:hypothetical protein
MFEVQFAGSSPISLAEFNKTYFNLIGQNGTLSTRQGFISDYPGRGVGGGINVTLNCSQVDNPQSLNSCPVTGKFTPYMVCCKITTDILH